MEVQPSAYGETGRHTAILSEGVKGLDYVLSYLEVYFELLLTIPDLDWLREARSYSLPNESKVLMPRLSPASFTLTSQLAQLMLHLMAP